MTVTRDDVLAFVARKVVARGLACRDCPDSSYDPKRNGCPRLDACLAEFHAVREWIANAQKARPNGGG